MAITHKTAYVAQVCMGADMQQLLTALTEAEQFDGPSLIIAYCPCIAHGYPMEQSLQRQKLAVDCGYWPLYRFHPTPTTQNTPSFHLDSKIKTNDFRAFLEGENRFRSLLQTQPEIAERLFTELQRECLANYELYQKLASELKMDE